MGWLDLCWDFWTIYKDDCDIHRFCWNFSTRKWHFHPQEVLIRWLYCLHLENLWISQSSFYLSGHQNPETNVNENSTSPDMDFFFSSRTWWCHGYFNHPHPGQSEMYRNYTRIFVWHRYLWGSHCAVSSPVFGTSFQSVPGRTYM